MPPPIRKYDALGFPIPSTFDDLQLPDRDGLPATKAAPSRPLRASRRKRIVLGSALVAILVVATVPWLKGLGQGLLGDWLAQRAREKFSRGDMAGTVADSTRAMSFLGDDLNDDRQTELLFIRAYAKLKINDLEGSRDDFDRVLTSPKPRRDVRILCYFQRSWANCRLRNFAAAVNDASAAIELNGRNNPTLLNQRAYIRALANTSKEELSAGLADVDRAIAMSRENAAFIDTRGYLLHLLSRNDEALREMKRAIELTENERTRTFDSQDVHTLTESLAVMYYHLGLIHSALGQEADATKYFRLADEYGYDPENGVL
jgi:tetratricopeptide (TPR) repeat protein